MQLKVYKALWGDAEARATRDDLQRIRAAGYDGVEFGVPAAEPAAKTPPRRRPEVREGTTREASPAQPGGFPDSLDPVLPPAPAPAQ